MVNSFVQFFLVMRQQIHTERLDECIFNVCTMVLLLYGNTELGAHVKSNFSYLICIGYSIRSIAVTGRICLSPERPIFFCEIGLFGSVVVTSLKLFQ